MTARPQLSEMDIHGFVDDALDEIRRREVAAIVASDPELGQRIDAFQADKETLRRTYGPLAAQPLPQEWLKLVEDARPRRLISWRLAGAMAATIVIAAVGVLSLLRSGTPAASEIVQAALDARSAAIPAAEIVEVGTSADPHRYDAMLSKAVALPVKVPDMQRMGYRLTSIELYANAPARGAAELVYRDRANRVFTLYVRRSNGQVRFDQFERAGLRICVWQDDAVGMVMAGNVSTAAMQRLASLAYTGLTG